MNTESCHCGLLSCKEVNTRDKDNKFTLQPLPYAENSLEPYISEKTVKFHYGKHLAAYIDNTNKLKAGTQFDDQPIHEIIKKASGGLFNNAAQVFNHYFYFEALHHSGVQAPRGKLSNLLKKISAVSRISRKNSPKPERLSSDQAGYGWYRKMIN